MDLDEILSNHNPEFYNGLNPPIDKSAKIPKAVRYAYEWHDGGTALLWNQYKFHSYAESEAKRLAFRKSLLSGGFFSFIIIMVYCPFALWSNPLFDFNDDGYYISIISGKIRYHFNEEWPKSFKSPARFWDHIKNVTRKCAGDFTIERLIDAEMASFEDFFHN